ncbi:maestro heat-like repeat family member 5 isoform X2 [Desmodus rotundus]|uniref:maestro heat-like repeat family member 5 isoform X2 n=2 Tax=Desmodus rotundus TaxID=9430 RepID=UPI002380CD24|nr:maestro heat-like repeat family member 5 isoform X2 [Desmodus rotundus]
MASTAPANGAPARDAPACPAQEDGETQEEVEEDLDSDFSGSLMMGQPLSSSPPWESALVGKIRAMSGLEKNLVLEAVCRCIQEQNQCITKEVPDATIQELLASLNLDLKQPLEKTFFFRCCGLILREFASGDLLRKHLAGLLELSHRSSSQRAGIALAIGIAATSHLEVVWAVLEHLGRDRFLGSQDSQVDGPPQAPVPTALPPAQQQQWWQPDPSGHRRWASSTYLLCYGQMAAQAGARILPWVDNIVSRIVHHYSCGSCGQDSALKTSFLSAATMLTNALQWEKDAQSYKFTQIPELIHCLLCILQKEPNFLATLCRQKIILVIMGLSSLRPSLKPTLKSRILQTCLQSLYQLPPAEALKSCLPPQKSATDVTVLYQRSMQALSLLLQSFVSENRSMDEVCFLLQHMDPWLKSDQSHERRRAVQSIALLLKCVVDYMKFTEKAVPSVLGHQIGLLMLLWHDVDEVTHSLSCQSVCLLLQLLTQQKGFTGHLTECPTTGNKAEFVYLNKMKSFEARSCRESEMKFYHLVKVLDETLTVAQRTELILTLLHGLCSHSRLSCDLASHLLLMVLENHSIEPGQVAEILQGLFQELPSIIFKDILQTLMKVVTVLGDQHIQETVEVMLSLCHPSQRQVAPLWKALATKSQLARQVITLLYTKLQLRPAQLPVRQSAQAELVSLLALGTIYELLYVREYKATVRWAFAGILLGLLTQLRYLFELGVVDGLTNHQEDSLEVKPLGPCRTCLEALKGLFWTTNYWEVFAYLKLLRGWELFEHLETYTEGVTLLARAMAHYDCEVKAVLGQAIISLKSTKERDNVVAILIITEFLNSQELTQYLPRKTMDNFLSLGLNNPNQLVRAMSLVGLSSTLLHPKKVGLLRKRLSGLLDSFLMPQCPDPVGLMEIVGDILHRLGAQGVGAVSLRLARLLRPLFEDRQEDVRGGAIFLYGDVIYSGGKKCQQALKSHAFQSLVPLLFHLADSCPKVVLEPFWKGSGDGAGGDLPFSAPAEDQVHLPALCHPAQLGVSEAAVQQVGVGPRAGRGKRHFYVHGGEQLWQMPPVSHAGVCLPEQPPQEPEADGHEVHRGHPAGLLHQPVLLLEEGRCGSPQKT